jgi:hypothetical protein
MDDVTIERLYSVHKKLGDVINEESDKPYATMTVELSLMNKSYAVKVYDSRRPYASQYGWFYHKKKEKAIAKAKEWLNSYEIIKVYKENDEA